ncbi:MAG: hypothetical protein DRH12_10350 [Deltaproteobacteria bacterium]|nr:MAG: hypothetical protein DRH12_10350 [Deltaproteobacteria bacterium]
MAQFDRVIPPGGRGTVTLKVKTKGYQGNVTKSARVYTNDPMARMVLLRISAVIKVPIYLSSRYVYFYGREGQKQTRVVDILAKKDKPLELTPIKFTLNDDKVTYDLTEVEKGKRFRIKFTTNNPRAGSYYGYLKLKTNYLDKPEIVISIRGRILGQTPRPGDRNQRDNTHGKQRFSTP